MLTTEFEQFKTNIYAGINDVPRQPTAQLAGNGSAIIANLNGLIDQLAGKFDGYATTQQITAIQNIIAALQATIPADNSSSVTALQASVANLISRIEALEEAGSGGGTVDPLALLLRFNNVDGSTDFVDESGKNHVVTATGSVAISTEQFKSGSSSLKLPGNGILQIATFAAGDSLHLADSDFTIEFWYYHIARSDYSTIITWDSTDYPLGIYDATNAGGGNIVFACGTDSSWFVPNLDMGAPVADTWVHYAITREGDTFRSFKDGTKTAEVTASGTISAPSTITIGGQHLYAVTAYLDDLRITKECLYNANFTPVVIP